MNWRIGFAVLLIVLLGAMIGFPAAVAGVVPEKPIIAVDLAHGENLRGLTNITDSNRTVEGMLSVLADYTFVYFGDPKYREELGINSLGAKITYDALKASKARVLIIGQPTSPFLPDEIQAIRKWLLEGGHVFWIAGDSDYGNGAKDQQIVNSLLNNLSIVNLRLDLCSVEDQKSNIGATYRVVAYAEPDKDTPYRDMLIDGFRHNGAVLAHGPGVVAWVDSKDGGGMWHPLSPKLKPSHAYVLVRSTNSSYIVENNAPTAKAYSAGENGPFPIVAAQIVTVSGRNPDVVIVSGETPVGGYIPMWVSEYYNIPLDGPKIISNILRWSLKVVSRTPSTGATVSTTAHQSLISTTEPIVTTGEASTISTSVIVSTSPSPRALNRGYIYAFIILLLLIALIVIVAEKRHHGRSTDNTGQRGLSASQIHTLNESSREDALIASGFQTSNGSKDFPPELLDKYEPLEFLGEGGFAKVFKVKRKSDGKIVAVKIPRIDRNTSKTFIREVSTWLQLNHPNIVKLYDVDILPVPHLEMEYVEGVDVDGKTVRDLDGYPMPVDEETALRLIRGIAEGLKHAHSKGIFHRDLKPLNVLLKSDLTPKITDWGLAKIGTMSSSRSVMGYTPLYAAPEQLLPGKYGHTDARTDIWQLGVIFYELLTERRPFEGYTYEEVFGKITDETYKFTPPSELNPGLAKYNGIFEKLLAKRKEERYGSVEELLRDLEKLEDVEKRKIKLEKEVEELEASLSRSVEALKQSKSAEEAIKNRKLVVETLGRLAIAYAELNRKAELLNTLNDLKFYTVQNLNDLLNAINTVETLLKEDLPVSEDFIERLKVLVHNIKRENGV